MIQNKQVNVWRGTDAPPTLYHLWLKDESQLLRYDDQRHDWVVFLDSRNLEDKITQFLERLANLSVNGHLILDSPTLDGQDITIKFEGNYLHNGQTVQDSLSTLDALMTTKVYGEE